MEKQPPFNVGPLLSRESCQGFCRSARGALTLARRLAVVLAIWLAFGLATHHLLMGAEGDAMAAAAPVVPTNIMLDTSAATVAPMNTMNAPRCCHVTCSGAMSSCPLMYAAKPALLHLTVPVVHRSVHRGLGWTADRLSFISALAARPCVGPPTQALLQVFLL